MKLASVLIFLPLPLWCGNTTALFQPSDASVGPFPSNALTLPSAAQRTGLQVNLPLPPGCTILSTSNQCINAQLLNQLDGFSINPRITVCFSGPVDVATLRKSISLMPVTDDASAIGIDQILFDPIGMCAYAKPEHVLDQQTNYLLVVSSDVDDANGKKVKADKDYDNCLKDAVSSYCRALSAAIEKVVDKKLQHGNGNGHIISASLFTTLSATNWLQQARAQVNSGALPGVGMLLGPMATFNLKDVQSVTWMPQTGVSNVNYNQTLPMNVLSGVDRISFGLYLSPLYLNTAGPQAGSISTTPTKAPIAPPSAVIPVSFHLFLPAAPANAKIPLLIYGHGLGDSQFGAPTFAASTWAQKGFATLSIEITGHGFGALSSTKVSTTGGDAILPTPGRGIQLSPTAPIGPSDGCILPNAIATRDCSRQTAVDLFALVAAIKNTQGLGLNLDTSRIYYTGQSFGAFYGTLFEAVEPNVGSGTLNSGGGTQVDAARLSPGVRPLGVAYLAGFAPPLLNVPPAPPQAYFHDSFNDEYVYRGQAIIDNVPGALPIQAAFEQADWLGMLGDPLSYAPHLKRDSLSGVPSKQILIQFGLGDLEVANPTESALARAGGLEPSTWLLRTDVAAAIDPRILAITQPGSPLPIYPHRFLSNPMLFDPLSPPIIAAIGLAAQKQVADFFATGQVPNPNQYFTGPFKDVTLFERPAVLPDRLNFLQIQP